MDVIIIINEIKWWNNDNNEWRRNNEICNNDENEGKWQY